MTTKQLPVRIPEEDYNELKAIAFYGNTTMNAIIAGLVHEFVAGGDGLFAAAAERVRRDHAVALDKLAHL